MALTGTPLWLQGGSYAGADDRSLISALVAAPGRVRADGLRVSARATPEWAVDVGAGQAFVAGSQIAGQGTYCCSHPMIDRLPIDPADATQTRIDLVVLQVLDEEVGDPQSVWQVIAVRGTLGGEAPAAPPSSLVLAVVTVRGGAANVIAADVSSGSQIAELQGAVKFVPGIGGAMAPIGAMPPADAQFVIVAGRLNGATNADAFFSIYFDRFPHALMALHLQNLLWPYNITFGVADDGSNTQVNVRMWNAGVVATGAGFVISYMAIGW